MYNKKCKVKLYSLVKGSDFMGRPPKIPYDEIPKMKFGKLKPIRMMNFGSGRTTWLCKCDCGKELEVTQKSLTTGNTTSCGCSRIENSGRRTHGHCDSKVYVIHQDMKRRCYNPSDKAYKWYGAIGVKVCDEWLNNFQAFYDWMLNNGYDENAEFGECTIDRIDPSGNYEPSNCRIITLQEQQSNRKDTIKITENGETHTLSEWARILGVSRTTLQRRMRDYGMSLMEAAEHNGEKLNRNCIRITYNGKTKSLLQWCKELEIPYSTAKARYKRGKTAEGIFKKK